MAHWCAVENWPERPHGVELGAQSHPHPSTLESATSTAGSWLNKLEVHLEVRRRIQTVTTLIIACYLFLNVVYL